MEKYFELSAVVMASLAAVTDLRSRRIPNWLTYSGLLMAVAARTIFGGWVGLKSGLTGVLVAGGIFCVLFFLGAMGGGDVKLMSAVGAWLGPNHAALTLITVCIAGGFIAFAYLLFGFGRPISPAADENIGDPVTVSPTLKPKASLSPRVPFGLAIAIGTVICAGSAFLRR